MVAFLPWIAGVFGLAFGSFLNLCVYRLPRHQSVVLPRSFCPACRTPIHWYDNIPLLSYLLLRRKCRACGNAIPWRYLLVEAATAILFYLVAARWQFQLETIKWLLFSAMLIVLFWTDLETRRLPDVLTLGGTAVAFLFAPFTSVPGAFGAWLLPQASLGWQAEISSAAGAAVLALPFAVILMGYAFLRRITPPGWGDVKLLAAIGAFLGVESGLVALFAGTVSGSVIGSVYILGTGKQAAKYKLPLGTFLCAGALAATFWGPKLFRAWWAPRL